MSKQNKKNRKAIPIICIIAACAFLIFSYIETDDYREANKVYDNIEADYTKDIGDAWQFEVDWDGLAARNEDIAAWIRLETGASYPVVMPPKDDQLFYLHKDIDKRYSINGSIFFSTANHPDFSDKNTIIYGHNMRNGSMFGKNQKYRDESFREEYPYFYIYTKKDGCRYYKIFSVMTVKDLSSPYTVSFNSENTFADYLLKMLELRSYKIEDAIPVETDGVITLSTCTNRGKDRLVIQGYLDMIVDTDGNVTYDRDAD